jgi:Holliday junction resolvase RusA-like endonuclease
MQSYCLSFELNELPPSLNVFMRWHYRKRASEFKRIENNCIKNILGRAPAAPLTSYQITFTRHTIRPLDIDNLVASFKPVLDSLVRSGVIEDDKWCTTDNLKYKQEKVNTKMDQKISILINEIN